MRWIFGDKRRQIPGGELAGSLFAKFVKEDNLARPETFGVPARFAAAFEKKALLYREATCLLVLTSEARQEKEYKQVLWEYERLVLPAKRNSRKAAEKLQRLGSAMADIAKLIQPKSRALHWSLDWFNDIGVEECNPAHLTLFATLWFSLYEEMNKAVCAVRPVGTPVNGGRFGPPECNAEQKVEFTEEESRAIAQFDAKNADYTRTGMNLIIQTKARDAWLAMVLTKYVEELMIQLEHCSSREGSILMDKAIKSQLKAYVIHNLPVYIFQAAGMFELIGDVQNATKFFRLFLQAQNAYKPDQIDTLFFAKTGFDLPTVIALAKRKCNHFTRKMDLL